MRGGRRGPCSSLTWSGCGGMTPRVRHGRAPVKRPDAPGPPGPGTVSFVSLDPPRGGRATGCRRRQCLWAGRAGTSGTRAPGRRPGRARLLGVEACDALGPEAPAMRETGGQRLPWRCPGGFGLCRSLDAEVREEVLVRPALLGFRRLQRLDRVLQLLGLDLLLVELLQVALVGLGARRHPLQVGAQPRLVVDDR